MTTRRRITITRSGNRRRVVRGRTRSPKRAATGPTFPSIFSLQWWFGTKNRKRRGRWQPW